MMTIAEVAEWLNGEIEGANPNTLLILDRVAKIEEAVPGCLTFLANPKYRKYLATTEASAVLISRSLDVEEFRNRPALVFIRVDDPYVAFLHALKRMTPAVEPFSSGIHPTAVIGKNASIGQKVSLGAYTVIGDGAVIGAGTKIGHGCVIGIDTVIGSDCLIYPLVCFYQSCIAGDRVIIHSGAVIGADGFGQAPQADGTYEKIPQLGIVCIEDDVEIGANTTIDRATLGETKVCRGVKIDNLVQVAHNVIIGAHTVIAAQTGISGSAKIGAHCMIAGQVGIAGHLEIADRTVIMAQSGVAGSLKEPGKAYFGTPVNEARKTQHIYAALKMLPDAIREITALKFKITELEHKLGEKHF